MQLNPGQPRKLVNGPVVRSDFRLLECSEALLNDIVREGVVIKGAEHEEAVLCTASKTFAIKYVETTNLQLLISPAQVGTAHTRPFGGTEDDEDFENIPGNILSAPGLQTQLHKLDRQSARTPDVTVSATNHAHLEVVETAPRLSMLEQLLKQRPYGLEDEGTSGASHEAALGERNNSGGEAPGAASWGLYTWEDLLGRVQASAAEVQAALKDLGAVQLGKYWRLMDPTYLGALLELLICSAQAMGHSVSALPADELCTSLGQDGYEAALVMHCLATYGAPAADDGASTAQAPAGQQQQPHAMEVDVAAPGRGVWALDERKVCNHFAAKLLAGGQLPAAELLAAWAQAVPEGLTPSLDMLKAEALVIGKGAAAVVKHFPIHKLPRDPAQRFAVLFAERPKWEASELEAYVADLKVPGFNVGALLLKYARASQMSPSEPLTYSAR